MKYAVNGISVGHWHNLNMPLTRDFEDIVTARLHSDPAFAPALLDAAITLFSMENLSWPS